MKKNGKPSPIKLLLSFTRSDGTDRANVSIVYLSPEDGKPRNFSSDSRYGCFNDDGNGTSGMHLGDLEIRAHWYQGSRDAGEWIGLEPEYYPYVVCLETAKKMAKTLTEVQKQMGKLNATMGYAAGLGQHIVRFGAALGASGYLVYRKYDGSDYRKNEFIEYDAGQMVHYCDEETKKKQAIAA